ncbi:Alpha/Beta hydrolase protein [Triangularia verruculosa]|uniref:Alpha/Beta hydrolase protein n=1 Tax=Triangularia verruculosa TaxID=2587418 RepID=A0AAN7ART5_9PEZI|nr:Alpha/Beta hydrolase protein [Triangularia verruculosa]
MAPAPSKPITLSILGKISLLFKLLVVAPPQLLINNLRCHILALTRGASLRYYTVCAFNKFALRYLTPLQLQFMLPPTIAIYKSWVRKQSTAAIKRLSTSNGTPKPEDLVLSELQVDIESLPEGQSSILWMGDRNKAKKVVLFFHGGGYAVPMLPGHINWCYRSYLLASPGEVAVAVLQYTLVPHGQYPTQLKQAAAGLDHLLKSGIAPQNIIFGGDSAGGNLAASLISHLLHPHPEAVAINLTRPIAGAFLVSPWVSAKTESPSFKKNGGIDMLSTPTINSACGELLPKDLKDEEKGWVIPVDMSQAEQEKWFAGLDKVVSEVYITAGEQEVFLDQTVQLADVFKKANQKLDVKAELMKNEAHDWILLEGGKQHDGDATKRMRTWVKGLWGFK